ncbi:hypothetical protein P691DRAFT_791955, partial [Macrolepiota fuliginosa MF-IS2]
MASPILASTPAPEASLAVGPRPHDALVEELAKDANSIVSTNASSAVSTLEKAEIWTGLEDDALPDKEDGKKLRFLRHQVFTLYRKLFGVVFLTNLAIFVWMIVREANALNVAGVAVANLFVSILHRQEYVVNTYYWLFTRVPLSLNEKVAGLSGSALLRLESITLEDSIRAAAYLAPSGLSSSLNKRPRSSRTTKGCAPFYNTISITTLTITYLIMALLIGILVFAYPGIRLKYHNKFEMAHRFMGWSAVGLVWAL